MITGLPGERVEKFLCRLQSGNTTGQRSCKRSSPFDVRLWSSGARSHGLAATGISRQPCRLSSETDLSRLSFREVQAHKRRLLFPELSRIPLRRCTARRPSHEWIRGHVFTHRYPLSEPEGSVISVLGRIASVFWKGRGFTFPGSLALQVEDP